jgi:2-polyprenyl-3-methyl-5-hydroxy-6-metoxy-1,4-benzoquinol methylase
MHPDLEYLRRIEAHADPVSLLREQKFLKAQQLFFSVVDSLGGSVDFDVADMREVHAIAALGEEVKGKRVLDIACGSTESYVLENTFRDRYPPFFAEMLVTLGANVTGTDIRPNPTASYNHCVLDLTKNDWAKKLERPYDILACFNVFNAPSSPFECNAPLCDRIMMDMHSLLSPDGLLIVTLRDDVFDGTKSNSRVTQYCEQKKFSVLHCDGNCAWLRAT